MPYVSQAQRRFFHSAGAKKAGITKKDVKHWDAASKGRKLPARKAKIVVNNKTKGELGSINLDSKGRIEGKKLKIQINVKAHKGDKAELASTIKHELLHAKHPKMTEKEIYKRSAKTKIPYDEQQRLVAKLRGARIEKNVDSLKKKYKLEGDTKPGDLINAHNDELSKQKLSIMGLV